MAIKIEATKGRKFNTFITDNPDSGTHSLTNMGGIVDVGSAHLNLTGYDMGEGTLVVRLIRQNIDFGKLDWCASLLAYRGNYERQLRSMKQMSKILDNFIYQFSKAEKAQIMRDVGCMTKSSFLEVSVDDQSKKLWMLFHSGAKTLSDIITNIGPDYYLDETSQMEDLQKVQKFAAFSRKMAVQRLFYFYYGTSKIDEAARLMKDYSYHTVEPENGKIYFASRPTDKWSLFLCNIRDGAILYQPRPQGTQNIHVGLSGCGRLDPVVDSDINPGQLIIPESLGKSMLGIHHRNKGSYSNVLPGLYQPVNTALLTQDSKIILAPIYNFRIE